MDITNPMNKIINFFEAGANSFFKKMQIEYFKFT